MTENEWLECTDPTPMLGFLRGKASDRKLRLFACACRRRIWHHLSDTAGKEAVEVAEQYADRLATATEQKVAEQAAAQSYQKVAHESGAFSDVGKEPPPGDSKHRALFAVQGALQTIVRVVSAKNVAFSTVHVIDAYASRRQTNESQQERKCQSILCRDIISNPFRPVTLATGHRTHTVVSLAQAAYDERQLPSGELDAHRLCVLADALEEAGATGELVAHLRGPGPHVRGCFAIDLCLGMS